MFSFSNPYVVVKITKCIQFILQSPKVKKIKNNNVRLNTKKKTT